MITNLAAQKRTTVRVYPDPIEIQLYGTAFLEVVQAKDISLGGVGIMVPHKFEGYDISGEVELLIKLPGARPFKARGIIRHRSVGSRGDLFGVQFTELPPLSKERVNAYVIKRVAEDGIAP
jgi:hypothetical protein